jgi:glycosyltransferase involved in cell wall biosynthesis
MPAGMRLLCLLNGGPDHPSTRFRILQHLETLHGRGLTTDLLVAKRDAGYGLMDLRRRALRADVVLVQKKLLARWKLSFLPRRHRILFDFDDALFEVSPDEEERFGTARAARRCRSRRRRLGAILTRSAWVLAGNGFLAAHARQVTPRVTILPTGVDLAPFPEDRVRQAAARRRARTGERLIGWIGSRPSLRYLAALAAPLREACARVPGARVVQVSNAFADLPGVPVETRAWEAGREPADLLDFDLGLMPLDDRPFSRGKCGLKLLQYQAAGVPAISSPVGANLEIVRPGVTGLLAADARSWTESIVRLLTDADLAARLGQAGRERVRDHYAAGSIGARLADQIVAVASGRVPRAASGRTELPDQEGEGREQSHQHERLLIADHLRERPGGALAGEGSH